MSMTYKHKHDFSLCSMGHVSIMCQLHDCAHGLNNLIGMDTFLHSMHPPLNVKGRGETRMWKTNTKYTDITMCFLPDMIHVKMAHVSCS